MEPEIELGQLFYSSMPEKENDRREKVEMREGERKKKKKTKLVIKKIASCSVNRWAATIYIILGD